MKKRQRVRLIANIVRHRANAYFYAKRKKQQLLDYGKACKYLMEFNSVCMHGNLPKLVSSKSDYQLARLVHAHIGHYDTNVSEFTMWAYSNRDFVIRWFLRRSYIAKGLMLPHIFEQLTREERNGLVQEATNFRTKKADHRKLKHAQHIVDSLLRDERRK